MNCCPSHTVDHEINRKFTYKLKLQTQYTMTYNISKSKNSRHVYKVKRTVQIIQNYIYLHAY